MGVEKDVGWSSDKAGAALTEVGSRLGLSRAAPLPIPPPPSPPPSPPPPPPPVVS